MAAALPGGDPLAAALAAGETPSPEMVAAAGTSSALAALPAIAALVVTLVCLLAIAAMADRQSLTSLVPTGKAPAVLIDRAAEITRGLGYTQEASDYAFGFTSAGDYLTYSATHPEALDRARLASGRPPVLVFWYRASPAPLVPLGSAISVSYTNPPQATAGMTELRLDTEGRLLEFLAVPPEVEDAGDDSTETAPWSALFAAAALDMGQFTPVKPEWTPHTHSSVRAAWEGPVPGWPDQRMRVETAAYRGRPVYFQLIWPWTQPARADTARASTGAAWFQTIATILAMSVLFGALLVARHNLRRGRGDRRGARLLATAVLLAALGAWGIGGTHVPILNVELNRMFDGLGNGLWAAAVIWVLYIALEPYVRRFWPSTLIAWSRMMSGQLRDPRVGRDILIGCLFAVGIETLERLTILVATAYGYSPQPSVPTRLSDLEGIRQLVAGAGQVMFNSLFNALWVIFGLVILKLIFRRVWVTSTVAVVFFLLATTSGLSETMPWWVTLPMSAIAISLILRLLLHYGLLAATVFFFVNFTVGLGVLTLDPGRWFFVTSTWTLLFAAAVAAYGFYAARGGEPLLGRRLLD